MLNAILFIMIKIHKHLGFTIVELLIVIVVIGILAAITIVAYNGVQARAGEATLKADLKSAATQLHNGATLSPTFLSGLSSSAAGITKSSDTTYQYTYTSETIFCITATTTRSGVGAFHYLSTDARVTSGPCAGHTGTAVAVPALIPNNAVVSYVAGSGTAGSVDGTGTGATFNTPYGLALDSQGNIIVAEQTGHKIRKINPATGVVTTIAGSGTQGTADGQGTAAQFAYPSDVAVDANDNIYVADFNTHRIRKITSTGLVSTLSGSSSGITNGALASAKFSYPMGLELDATGNFLYVVDRGDRLRVIDLIAGMVTAPAGSGTSGSANGAGTAAQFYYPTGIAVDSANNVYISQTQGGSPIRKVSATFDVTTIAGGTNGYVNGTGTTALFNQPGGLAIDSAGTLYVADTYNGRIRKISPAGEVTTFAGSGAQTTSTNGTGTAASFKTIMGIVVSPTGTIYVSEATGHRIRKIE